MQALIGIGFAPILMVRLALTEPLELTMKIVLRVLIAITISTIFAPPLSLAGDCSSPPVGFGGAWAEAYRKWCINVCGGSYDSSNQSCTPPSQQQTPSYTPQQPSYDHEAERRRLEAQRQRQRDLETQMKKEKEEQTRRQQEFEQNKQDALRSMKGMGGEIGLKGADTGKLDLKSKGNTDIGLKQVGDSSVVDLSDKRKPYVVNLNVVKGGTGQFRQELLGNFSETIRKRTDRPNEQAQNIMQSFKTGEPLNPVKNIVNLSVGDVILVAPYTMKAPVPKKGLKEKEKYFKDVMISNGINLLDRWASDNWSSPASHAAIFLGDRNNKRWYLDNTGVGPVIKEEEEFLKEYGQRPMDVATLVGQPLSQHEGEEMWKGAHELRNTTTYWPSGVPNVGRIFTGSNSAGMVCSEASRWMLLRAGRTVPETESESANIVGIDTGLNKKQFVTFSPSDFYEEQQYFVIHQLGIKREGKTGQ